MTNLRYPSRESPSPNGTILPRPTLGAQVADYIRTGIYDGTFGPDERIPQDAIAAELGVSRVPVREALIALEEIGLVTSKVHRGVFVQPIHRDDITDHFHIYGQAQGLAAANAAMRITESDLTRLRELHAAIIAGHDVWTDNAEFHRHINRTGSSRRLRFVLRTLSLNLSQDLFLIPNYGDDIAIADHAAIIDALETTATESLLALCLRHAERDGIAVIAELTRRGVLRD